MKNIKVGDYVMVVFNWHGTLSKEVAKVLTVTDNIVVVFVKDRRKWYYRKDVMPWYS